VKVACAGPCRVKGTMKLEGRTIATGKATSLKGGAVKVTLKVASKKTRNALRRMRSAKLAIAVTTTPATGRATTLRRTVKLKR
jgi:hypothetical protein